MYGKPNLLFPVGDTFLGVWHRNPTGLRAQNMNTTAPAYHPGFAQRPACTNIFDHGPGFLAEIHQEIPQEQFHDFDLVVFSSITRSKETVLSL